jgi:Tfp pilus assembly protein FimT
MRINRRSERGVTLIELAVICAILGVMLAIGMPYFNATIVKMRGRAAVERVATDLRYALSQAVKEGTLYSLYDGNAAGQAGKYRLERSTNGGATWTPVGTWYSLALDYNSPTTSLLGIKDTSGAGATVNRVIFNSQGAVTASPATANYPIGLNVTTPADGTRTILVMRTGNIRMPTF